MLGTQTPNFVDKTIWTGDNLKILRGMNAECVDLIYLDPPFNSTCNSQKLRRKDMLKRIVRYRWLLVATMLAVTLAMAGCSATPTVMNVTETIPAGQFVEWDLSELEACRYHFTVRQTGMFGSVDIKFQGRRYTEKDGVFYGDTFTLSNGHSLSTAKVVDIILRCP